MSDGVVEFRARMSEAQYDRERAALRETYGDNSKEAGAKRDQALALLFARSKWTQEELAKKEGKSQTHLAKMLRFGRFLSFSSTELKPENRNSDAILSAKNLTERKFRDYWSRTEGSNERQRFVEVQKLMAEHLVLRENLARRPKIGPAIIEKFRDGKWHSPEAIAKVLDTTPDHVEDTFHNMLAHETYDTICEKKPVGKSHHYRIFPKRRDVSREELITKLGPLVEQLKHEGRKRVEAAAPAIVAGIAHEIQKLLDEWTR